MSRQNLPVVMKRIIVIPPPTPRQRAYMLKHPGLSRSMKKRAREIDRQLAKLTAS